MAAWQHGSRTAARTERTDSTAHKTAAKTTAHSKARWHDGRHSKAGRQAGQTAGRKERRTRQQRTTENTAASREDSRGQHRSSSNKARWANSPSPPPLFLLMQPSSSHKPRNPTNSRVLSLIPRFPFLFPLLCQPTLLPLPEAQQGMAASWHPHSQARPGRTPTTTLPPFSDPWRPAARRHTPLPLRSTPCLLWRSSWAPFSTSSLGGREHTHTYEQKIRLTLMARTHLHTHACM